MYSNQPWSSTCVYISVLKVRTRKNEPKSSSGIVTRGFEMYRVLYGDIKISEGSLRHCDSGKVSRINCLTEYEFKAGKLDVTLKVPREVTHAKIPAYHRRAPKTCSLSTVEQISRHLVYDRHLPHVYKTASPQASLTFDFPCRISTRSSNTAAILPRTYQSVISLIQGEPGPTSLWRPSTLIDRFPK